MDIPANGVSLPASPAEDGLKEQVRAFWNSRPCGTQFTRFAWGTPEFFADVERTRYASHPFMRNVAEFDSFRGQQLLEIGAGLGTDLLQFARAGANVTAIDLTPRSIELLKLRFQAEHLPVDARVGDAEHLPFADRTFDAVYSFGVLHHTPSIDRAIAEIHRVLRPGGRIIIMLYHQDSLRVWLGAPLHGIRKVARGEWLGTSAATVADWIRIYDGVANPLGRAYTRADVERLFGRFRDRRYTVCHPVRLSLPPILQRLIQSVLAPWFGFFLVLKARR
jgi:SAM-dependent methyltransferase